MINKPASALSWLSIISAWLFLTLPISGPLVADETPNAFDAPVHDNGVVAADHPLASAAGVEILKQGGNVVDAAVATGFALSVLRPGSSGIGGGGFMVIWNAETKSAITLDYRERAPLAASREMFTTRKQPGNRPGGTPAIKADLQKPNSNRPGGTPAIKADVQKTNSSKPRSSRTGPYAVGIPGHVRGLCYAQKKYGRLNLADVLAPAIRYAQQGVLLDQQEVDARSQVAKRFVNDPTLQKTYGTLWKKYLLEGKLDTKTKFFSPQLPALRAISKSGGRDFYHGKIAAAVVSHLKQRGGIATLEDFQKMDVVTRQPIVETIGKHQFVCMPPPSSGGVALVETLRIIASFEKQHAILLSDLEHNSRGYIHLVTEAMKHSFADRAEFLGDADHVSVPVEDLIGDKNAKVLAARIDAERTQSSKSYGRFVTPDDSGTSHFSIMDAAGNAVACTETINTVFGSLEVEPTYGIVLNNEMDDFAARPGKPNAYGLIQSEANAVAARKKPLSSMSPTIAVKNGKAVLAVGGSGGPRIISNTIQVVLNRLRFEMPLNNAVSLPRFHHQWIPDLLYLEAGLHEARSSQLQTLGHKIQQRKSLAVIQAVGRSLKDPTKLVGFSDPRKRGRAVGY